MNGMNFVLFQNKDSGSPFPGAREDSVDSINGAQDTTGKVIYLLLFNILLS